MKVKLNRYSLDISNDSDKKEYETIKSHCEAQGFKVFSCIPNDSFENSYLHWPAIQTIDDSFLFNNQFNSVEGYRLFFWYEHAGIGWDSDKNRKHGYYLSGDIAELKEAQANQLVCGYCGKRYQKKETKNAFCVSCIGSEYLDKSDLNLLRLLPVSDQSKREELSENEKDHLLPLYEQKQNESGKARILKEIERKKKSLLRAQEEHQKESDCLKALLDLEIYHKPIYYSHKGIFCFNWDDSLKEEELKELAEKLSMSELPYQFEIKGAC